MALELQAVASRVPNVSFVTKVLVAKGDEQEKPEIKIEGLQLPRVLGISVTEGDPIDLDLLRGSFPIQPGQGPTGPDTDSGTETESVTPIVPLPVVPQECK